jgi:plastocyanin
MRADVTEERACNEVGHARNVYAVNPIRATLRTGSRNPEKGAACAFEVSLEASAGAITIEFTNPAAIPHNVSVDGQTSETIAGGATTTLDLELEAGEYDFICAVAGHAAGGMTGTLTVE